MLENLVNTESVININPSDIDSYGHLAYEKFPLYHEIGRNDLLKKLGYKDARSGTWGNIELIVYDVHYRIARSIDAGVNGVMLRTRLRKKGKGETYQVVSDLRSVEGDKLYCRFRAVMKFRDIDSRQGVKIPKDFVDRVSMCRD